MTVFARADKIGRDGGQIAMHELFHDVLAKNPQLRDQLINYLYDNYSEAQIARIVGAYSEAFDGIYGDAEGSEYKYLEEALCDVYAQIRRGKADVGIVRETMGAFGDQIDQALTRSQTERAVRDTRGSPEVKYSSNGKNNTKLSATTPLSGSLPQKAGSIGTDNQVTAAAELLGIGDTIAQANQSVKDAIKILAEFHRAVQESRSAFNSKNPITADNLTGMLVKKGVLRRESTGSAYRVDSGHTLRVSNHHANTANFKTSDALSVVLKGGKISSSFYDSPNKNVVEVVFSKKYLNEHPEELQKLISDLGYFIVTGKYKDSVKAREYNTSGNPQRVMYSVDEEEALGDGLGTPAGLGRQGESADVTYQAAIERGDMETAQRMVDEAAQEAGYTIKAYHGTRSGEFHVFDRARIGENYGGYNAGEGFDFTNSDFWARRWGSKAKGTGDVRVMPVYLKAENTFYSYQGEVDPRLAEQLPDSWSSERKAAAMKNGAAFHEAMRELGVDFASTIQQYGYDSYAMYEDADNITVYNEEQIKSADPVTYDDDGNVIPLSERFDESKPDIRWSVDDAAEDGQAGLVPTAEEEENGRPVTAHAGAENGGQVARAAETGDASSASLREAPSPQGEGFSGQVARAAGAEVDGGNPSTAARSPDEEDPISDSTAVATGNKNSPSTGRFRPASRGGLDGGPSRAAAIAWFSDNSGIIRRISCFYRFTNDSGCGIFIMYEFQHFTV